MGLLTALFDKRSHPSNPAQWLLEMGLRPTASGVNVTEQGSLSSTAVFACARILAESAAMLPLILYRRRERGKDRATGHTLYPILHNLPNPEMTSMELRETLTGHLATWGNAYAEIEISNGGRIKALWPLRPDITKPKRVNKRIIYEVSVPGESTPQKLFNDQVMHIKGLGFDGNVGYSPIGMARQAIGLALATEEFGARFFGNGARPSVVLTHPGVLSEEAYDRLRKNWEDKHQGLEKAHRMAILEEGVNVETIGIPPEDAQFLETRKFQVQEIARLFRVPPHMLADMESGASYASIEQMSLEFVTYTLAPWLVRWEQAIYRDLLSERERVEYFAEHLVDALLRGDLLSRYQAYNIGRNGGWLSANDIREIENMNPTENGDVYLVPLNMVPADEASAGEQGIRGAGKIETRLLSIDHETRAQDLAKARRKLAKAYERIIKDAVQRVVKREIADVRRAADKFLKRDAFQFATWLKQFYVEHKVFWQRQLLPILLSYADQVGLDVADELNSDAYDANDIAAFIEQYTQALADREAGSSQLQLQALLDEAGTAGIDPGELISTRLDEWDEKRVDKITRREKHLALNAFVVAFYVKSGVTKKRWVTTGDSSCPYCKHLNGKVVGVEKFFIEKDTDFKPDGADRPLSVRFSMGHGPAHGGCDCTIVAERE